MVNRNLVYKLVSNLIPALRDGKRGSPFLPCCPLFRLHKEVADLDGGSAGDDDC